MFIRNLREELYRGFHNRGMYAALGVSIIFVGLHFFFYILRYAASYIGTYANLEYPYSVFYITLLFDTNAVFPIYYSYIFPLLAALPYSASYYEECKNGYRNQILLRGGISSYLWSKYIAVFITAGIAAIAPALLDLMITMACVPSVIPQIGTALFCVGGQYWMGGLYYTHPFIYTFLYLLVLFCLAGILASVGLAVSAFVSGKYIVLFVPFIFTLVTESILIFIGKTGWKVFNIVSQGSIVGSEAGAVFIMWLVVAVCSFLLFYWAGGKKHDKI